MTSEKGGAPYAVITTNDLSRIRTTVRHMPARAPPPRASLASRRGAHSQWHSMRVAQVQGAGGWVSGTSHVGLTVVAWAPLCGPSIRDAAAVAMHLLSDRRRRCAPGRAVAAWRFPVARMWVSRIACRVGLPRCAAWNRPHPRCKWVVLCGGSTVATSGGNGDRNVKRRRSSRPG